MTTSEIVLVLAIALAAFAMSVKVVKQYEIGVVFRPGRVQGSRNPGLQLIIPFVDVMYASPRGS